MNRIFLHSQFPATLLLALLLLLASCGQTPPEVVVEDFPEEYSLKGKGIDSLNRYVGMYCISMAGDKFVAERNGDKFLLVLDGNYRLLQEALPKGHGHGEFLAPRYCGQYMKEGNEEYIYVLERTARQLYRVSLSASGEPLRCVVDIPESAKFEPAYLFRPNDSVCVGANNSGNNPFVVMNMRDGRLQTFEPSFPFEGNEAELFEQSQNTAAYAASQGRVAIAYFNLPQLDIRSVDGSLQQTVVYQRKLSPSELDCEDLKDYFGFVTSTDQHIYAKYDGDEQKAAEGRTWILVFDWDGAPVCRMEIDASVSFAVDEAHGRIVALNEDDTEFVASEYALPDLLRQK